MRVFTVDDFDFRLPPELVAQHPAATRSASRLLDGRGALPVDRVFSDLPGLLREGDLLVSNDTKVMKARLFGHKPSGAKVELLIERVLQDNEVLAHMKVGRKPRPGAEIHMQGGFTARLLGRRPDALGALFHLTLRNDAGDDPYALMARHGHVPLPPYIGHADSPEDEARYQSLFARHPGAVAAPTAALHFDAAVLAALQARGVRRASLTLHVGAGTFAPVKVQRIGEHVMHHEWYRIPDETIAAIEATRRAGGRIVAVGTTTTRTLESWARDGRRQGDTDIFITPGFAFQVVDLLVTNFHLPRSTLLMLVSAFAGHQQALALYRHAIERRYRFYSYGDAMVLQRQSAHAAL
jgi:S-adenosylmethionine:tRNA ribosyltransferase-isomerase